MVNVNINGNIEVTEAIQEHIQHYADKLEKFNTGKAITVEVHLKKVHKTQFSAVLTASGKSSTSNSEDMYQAITSAFEKMETILSKDKGIKLHKRTVQVDFTPEEE